MMYRAAARGHGGRHVTTANEIAAGLVWTIISFAMIVTWCTDCRWHTLAKNHRSHSSKTHTTSTGKDALRRDPSRTTTSHGTWRYGLDGSLKPLEQRWEHRSRLVATAHSPIEQIFMIHQLDSRIEWPKNISQQQLARPHVYAFSPLIYREVIVWDCSRFSLFTLGGISYPKGEVFVFDLTT